METDAKHIRHRLPHQPVRKGLNRTETTEKLSRKDYRLTHTFKASSDRLANLAGGEVEGKGKGFLKKETNKHTILYTFIPFPR